MPLRPNGPPPAQVTEINRVGALRMTCEAFSLDYETVSYNMKDYQIVTFVRWAGASATRDLERIGAAECPAAVAAHTRVRAQTKL
jgi:hypothetical protein